MRRPSKYDLRQAAQWLDCYDTEAAEFAVMRKVAEWLWAEANKADHAILTRQIALDTGKPVAWCRRAATRLMARERGKANTTESRRMTMTTKQEQTAGTLAEADSPLTWLIGADCDLSDCPGDPVGTLFGDVDPVHETRAAAMAAIKQLDSSGDWPDGRPVYRLGTTTMPAPAARALYKQREYNIGEVLSGWERGDYGELYDRETAQSLRAATAAEAAESLAAGPDDGVIEVDGRDCYVSF